MALGSKLIKNIESMKGTILSAWEAGDLVKSIKEGRVEFRVPDSVTCRFEHDYNIGRFWCPLCGALYSWNDAGARGFRCSNCNVELAQSYLFSPYFDKKPERAPALGQLVEDVLTDRNSYCPILHRHKSLKRDDQNRPVESLSWYCPDVKMRASCEYSDQGWCKKVEQRWGKAWTTRNGHVRVHKPAGITSMTGTSINFRQSPALPSESITKALQASIHSYDQKEVRQVDFQKILLPGIESIWFAPSLLALTFSLAIAVGYPTSSLYSRTMIVNKEEDAEGRKRTVFLSRRLKTKGLVIKPEEKLFEGLEDDLAAISKILHTISHAFLKHLPLQTGLEPTEFFESIDADAKEIALFDNQPGGIGGVNSVADLESEELDPDYQELVSSSGECDLDCPAACKACLYVENCGRLNRQLNRYLLQGVLQSA